MLAVTAVWVAVTVVGSGCLVSRVYRHMASLRESEERLYHRYESVIDGRKELTLNRKRAQALYEQAYQPDAQAYRYHIIRADTFHLSALNWSNIMMLGAIGLVFFMANSLGWADSAVAATYSLTLLFLRTPLLQAVGAFPTLVSAEVAFNKLKTLRGRVSSGVSCRRQPFPADAGATRRGFSLCGYRTAARFCRRAAQSDAAPW